VPAKFSVFIIFLFLLIPALAQTSGSRQLPAATTPDNPTMNDEDEARTRLTNDMAKKAAKQRVAALKNDTDKLLKLSIELKAYVDKSDENVLSVDVIKRAEEIEKLARSVKDKMKGPN
jgi:ABC-type Fe3+-hydroxamate transport system substrate-binding protein